MFNSCSLLGSDCFRAGLTGADTHDFFQVSDEHFAVADLAGTGGVDDGLNDLLSDVVGDSQLDLGLGQKVDDVLGAAVQLRVATLATEAFNFSCGDALHTDIGDGLANVIKFERLDDGGNKFHFLASVMRV